MPQSPAHITATGIRIVGSAAAALAAEAATIPLTAPAPRDALWAARFRVRPRLGKGSPVPALLEAIGTALRADWDACPAVTRETPFVRPAGRFRGIAWDVIGDPGTWRGELVWRHQHPRIAGTGLTTHLVIDEQQQITTLTLVAAAEGGVNGVRGIVGAGQSRPPLLDALRGVTTLTFDGHDGLPQPLADADVTDFVRTVLLSDDRDWPVAVLAPLEEGGYLVPPEQLADELFGLAPLHVIERHSGTYKLTDAIGDRRLSAYWGAMRVYRTEFSCADRSEDHWLLMRDRLDDPLARAIVLGSIAQSTMQRIFPVEGVAARRAALEPPVPTPVVPVAGPEPTTVEPTPTATAPVAIAGLDALTGLPDAMAQLAAQLRDLTGAVGHLVAINAQLSDEMARLRTATAIRASANSAVDRRLERIESHLMPPAGAAESTDVSAEERDDAGDALPTLRDIVRQAGSEHSDALLILESAEKAAADSPYEDVDRVGVILQAMAYISRRRQEGGLGTGLRAAFQEVGIDYRGQIGKTTSENLRQQYRFLGPDGTVHECHEHIALGGGSYDPRYVLRIYFTSRSPSESRFVIGHVGRHLTVMTTT